MSTTSPADMHTDIRRNRENRDYDVFAIIDGVAQYLGSRERYDEAEAVARDFRWNYFLDNHTPEMAVRELSLV
jgi:hypothetical protein